VQVLGCHMVRQQVREGPIYEQLRRFLKLFLDLILSQQINSELIPNSSATLYVLICLYQDTYQQLVEHLVQSQVLLVISYVPFQQYFYLLLRYLLIIELDTALIQMLVIRVQDP
jgi:hypothetical protein